MIRRCQDGADPPINDRTAIKASIGIIDVDCSALESGSSRDLEEIFAALDTTCRRVNSTLSSGRLREA